MKRFVILLPVLFLALFAASALAAPLSLGPEWAGSVFEPYDPSAPDGPGFTYSWAWPRISDDEPDADAAAIINGFYDYLVSDTLDNFVPLMADSLRSAGVPASMGTTYRVTCNNDDYFSLLICQRTEDESGVMEMWSGHTFSRRDNFPGETYTLPRMLGSLNQDTKTDTWLENRQTAKADALVRSLVWQAIQTNDASIPYYEDLEEETLDYIFFPEQDFYLDASGEPVFFLQPGDAAPAEAGRLDFPLAIDVILDEM